ncbi:hypothetical protein CEP51_008561 [Fusarium floridanum]|uniref:Prion-inhibition and propagation HeLo domain-containing protein n=1 Tax=Fusarium floridanum TaxID=1325733 RepID=A0A428RKJ8_9HYPO|nr:hypothetical protein CEP51_008561 [Fusarium floridanum]
MTSESAQSTGRLEGIPFVVDEIRKAFSKLALKTAGIDLNGQDLKDMIAVQESRFVIWMATNDANRDADSSPKSPEHWRTSHPQAYGRLSYSLLNVKRLLESIDLLLNETLDQDKKAVLALFTAQASDALKCVESITSGVQGS